MGSAAVLVGLLSLACAGPAPELFPAEPIARRDLSGGGVVLCYDIDNDGAADFAERLSPEGRIVELHYDSANTAGLSAATQLWHRRPACDPTGETPVPQVSSTDANVVVLAALAAEGCRELFIILDSIPFELVKAARKAGRFRLFHPPSRIISPFPVMTDLCLSEFFDVSPCPGVESMFYDGERLTDGYGTYVGEANLPWLRSIDYHLDPRLHGAAYLRPRAWFDHELRRIQALFGESNARSFDAYAVAPSGIGMKRGREGHLTALARLDRFCKALVYEARGRLRITLMSDHGHAFAHSRRLDLAKSLKRAGFRPTGSLHGPGDVVIPEFGLVTSAAIHTREPGKVAAAVVGLQGVDLVAYLDDCQGSKEGRPATDVRAQASDCVVVLSADGRATLSRRGDAYRYIAQAGDPLRLGQTLERLRADGLVDADGFVADAILFDATVENIYPDAAHRLWRAFHGLVRHTPDVLVSLEDGYHHGSSLMSAILDPIAAHGNLRAPGSSGFVMTMAGPLPAVLRMDDVREALAVVGVSTLNRARSVSDGSWRRRERPAGKARSSSTV